MIITIVMIIIVIIIIIVQIILRREKNVPIMLLLFIGPMWTGIVVAVVIRFHKRSTDLSQHNHAATLHNTDTQQHGNRTTRQSDYTGRQ
jgi:uncharacterized membrane-anchored protein YitT (DUF2179 family)